MSKLHSINLQSPFERLKEIVKDPCVALARAIILQAMVDLSSKDSAKSAVENKYQSMKWIFVDNDNFLHTCFNSNLEPSYVRQIASKFVKGVIDESSVYQMIIEKKARREMKESYFVLIENESLQVKIKDKSLATIKELKKYVNKYANEYIEESTRRSLQAV